MIEVAGLPIEGVRVGVMRPGSERSDWCNHRLCRRVVGTGFDRVDRIFLGIGVQVAHDQEVGVAAAGRVGGKPVDQGLRGGLRVGCSSLAVAEIRITDIDTVRAFGFEVIDHHREARASGIDLEGLRQRRTILGIDEAGSMPRSRSLEVADRGNHGRSVDQPTLIASVPMVPVLM